MNLNNVNNNQNCDLSPSNNGPFNKLLQSKIDRLKNRRNKVQLGTVSFDSPLLLAPMSAIGTAPFRRLMEDLGAGGTVSELISCHGINYKNHKTREMLLLSPHEKNVGLQIFGEGAEAMAQAAQVVQEYGPKFIDINMGCPVRKVVGTGAGSSLLKDPSILPHFFKTIKKSIALPLSIKIRTGWDEASINALEIVHIAREEGIEFVAIHGRTRAQQYEGQANWEIIEHVASNAALPIIGNGDLNKIKTIQNRMQVSHCRALMLGRGPLRDPFLFLTPYIEKDEAITFNGEDIFEVIRVLLRYNREHLEWQALRPEAKIDPAMDHKLNINIRKHLIWLAASFQHVATFREMIFKTQSVDESLKIAEDFFKDERNSKRRDITDDTFMTSGHG